MQVGPFSPLAFPWLLLSLVACALAADTTDPASMFDIHANNKHVVALHRCLGGHHDLDIEVAPSTWKDSCDSRN